MENIYRLLESADENLIGSIKNRMNNIKGSSFEERDGLFLFSIGEEALDGHLNGAIMTGKGLKFDYEVSYEKALEFFKGKGISFVFWIRAHCDHGFEEFLKSKGLTPKREPGSSLMVLDKPFSRIDMTVRINHEERHLGCRFDSDFEEIGRIISGAFKKDAGVAKMIGSSMENSILASKAIADPEEKVRTVAVTLGDEIVGCAMVFFSRGTAGVYWVGVHEDYRRLGIGAIITKIASNEGFGMGASEVVLQASIQGERVYEAAGFKTYSNYRWYEKVIDKTHLNSRY